MKPELQEVIAKSTFTVREGVYVYAKVRSFPKTRNHFLVSQDSEEITVVTQSKYFSELDVIERNKDDYALISLDVSIPFYCVGFLAEVSAAVAAKDMNILIVSTYSKDYIMVRSDLLSHAEKVLLDLGFKKQN